MRPSTLTLLLVIVGFLAAAASGRLFRDPFRGKLADGWSWIREQPDAWRLADGALEMRILPGNLWGGANNARNILVRPAPLPSEGDVQVTVRFDTAPTAQYEQMNLAWYYDDSHMVKLGREVVDGTVCVVMGREEADRCRTIAQPPVPGAWYRLRLTVSGNRIRGEYWPDGATAWKEAGACDLPTPPAGATPMISLHGYNGSPTLEHWARITEFELVQHPGR